MQITPFTKIAKEVGADKALATAVKEAAGIAHNAAVEAVNDYVFNGHKPENPLLADAIAAHFVISEELHKRGLTPEILLDVVDDLGLSIPQAVEAAEQVLAVWTSGSPVTATSLAATIQGALGVADTEVKTPPSPALASPNIMGGIDLNALMIDEEQEAQADRDEAEIKVGRPRKQEFFRAHPTFRAPAFIFEEETGGMDKEIFLIPPNAKDLIGEDDRKVRELKLLVTNFGQIYLYPMGVPTDGGGASWVESARAVVRQSEREWLRMVSRRNEGRYVGRVAEDQPVMGDPVFPAFEQEGEILIRAFGEDRIITDRDHPAILRLRGKAIR